MNAAADPFDLERFRSAQASVIDAVEDELRRGRKQSHWMWFIFPQFAGLGSSPTARHYAIASLAEARAYAADPVLGSRLLSCTALMLAIVDRSATDVLGSPDDMKFRSSMTLFALADPGQTVFACALDRYFDGHPDPATVRLVSAMER